MSVRPIAIVPLAIIVLIAASPLRAQIVETPAARLGRTRVEAIPIGATVKLRTRNGQRLKAVLFGSDETGIIVKPATRIPEPSRRIAYGEIDRIDRYQDHVSVGKYASVGASIGGAALMLLIMGAF